MEPDFSSMQASTSRLEVFAGAHDFHVGDMKIIQAQSVHNHNHNYSASDLSQLLNPVHDASHTRNRRIAPPDSQCLAGTRRDVFRHMRSWLKYGKIGQEPEGSEGDPPVVRAICWMYGAFGCGKSAIAQTMAEKYASRGRLAASFFFFRGAGRRGTIDGFIMTLVHQVALNVPGARELIERVVTQDPGVVQSSRSLTSQLQDLVYLPLLQCIVEAKVSRKDPYLIIVDGMDECEDKEGISSFIDTTVAFFSSQPHIPLRLLITSRVEEHIRTHIEDGSTVIHLFDLSSRSNSADVESAMRATFDHAKKHDRALRAYGSLWPNQDDMETLVDYCEGSFIFGSTIARFILQGSGNHDPRTPMERLNLALNISPGIDGVYAEVLTRTKNLPYSFIVISTIACLQEALSISAIAALLGLPTYEVIRVLVTLQAILQVPGRDDEPVTFFHTSLRDFLTDQTRSGEFYCPPSFHIYLVDRCLDVIVGTEPTANVECCKYAMMYMEAHLHSGVRLDDAFKLDERWSDRPYNTIDRDEWKKCNFTSRRGERRPIKFTMTIGELSTMSLNTAVAAEMVLLPEFKNVDRWTVFDRTRWWSSQRSTERDLVWAKSLHTCSFLDVLRGLYILRNYEGSMGMEARTKRGEGVYVVINKRWVLNSRGRRLGWEFTIEDRVDPVVTRGL